MPGLIYNTQSGIFPHSNLIDPTNPVNWQHPLNVGRVAWWRCVANPGWRGGKTLHDLVRGGGHTPHDGTLSGATLPKWGGNRGLAASSGSLFYNGSSAYVSIGSASTLTLKTSPCTVAVWVKYTSVAAYAYLISDGALEGGVITLGLGNLSFFRAIWGGGIIIQGSNVSSPAIWYRVIATRSGTSGAWLANLYVNGVSNATQVATATNPGSQSALNIGSYDGTEFYTTGYIDDITVWNRALTPQDVALDYQLSRQGYPGVLNYLNPIEYSFPTLSDNSVASATGSSTASATSNVVNAVSSITYNGVALTFIGAQNAVGSVGRVESWGLVNPPQGTNPIVVNMLGSATTTIGTAASYTGVNQTQPTESWSGNYAVNTTSSVATVVVTPATTGDWLHAAIATNATSVTAGQTTRNNVGGASGSGSNEDTGPVSPAPTPMTYII